MIKKDKFQRLAVGVCVFSGLSSTLATEQAKDDVFAIKETFSMQRCYWLSRKIPAEGLCGEKMRPDVKVLVQEAGKGNSIAAMRLGQLYASGNWGVEQDLKEAVHWYAMAAELGDRYSQLRLGQAYEFGRMGVDVDIRSAIKFYKMATENDIYPDLEKRIKQLEEELSEAR